MEDANPSNTPLPPGTKLQKADSKPLEENVPYREAVGALMHLMVCTRPDISFALGLISRYLTEPAENHWNAVKYIFRYLKATKNVGITYGKTEEWRRELVTLTGEMIWIQDGQPKDMCFYLCGWPTSVEKSSTTHCCIIINRG